MPGSRAALGVWDDAAALLDEEAKSTAAGNTDAPLSGKVDTAREASRDVGGIGLAVTVRSMAQKYVPKSLSSCVVFNLAKSTRVEVYARCALICSCTTLTSQ